MQRIHEVTTANNNGFRRWRRTGSASSTDRSARRRRLKIMNIGRSVTTLTRGYDNFRSGRRVEISSPFHCGAGDYEIYRST